MRAAGCSSCYSRGEENFATAVVSRLKSSAFLRRIAICSVSLVVTILGGEVVGFVFSSFLILFSPGMSILCSTPF